MEIHDRVYGKVMVDEPLLSELMATSAVQRLKGINQAGASQYIMHKPITRYEHSVGTMLLLKKFGAPLSEQVAGLLHDVAHTAFSHVIDFAFPNENHDFHESFHERIVLGSEIPSILKSHGLDLPAMFDEANFPLLERSLPDLCADRLDYSFRDMVGYVAKAEMDEHVQLFLSHLIVHEGEFIFDDFQSAAQFTLDFIFMNRWVWARPLEVATYHILGKALRRAYDLGYLTMDDLFGTDEQVMQKLRLMKDLEINAALSKLTPKFRVSFVEENADFYCRSKPRYVDPKFLENGKVRRVSEVSKALKKEIRDHREYIQKGYMLKVG